MLDDNIKTQLREVFSRLTGAVTLRVSQSSHEKQAELLEMLRGVVALSPKLALDESGPSADTVRFDILAEGRPTGIVFRAVPGGHEFTSLVVAILNADGKGKLPDSGVLKRIANLKGPIRVQSYISLSCTNCPDVVMALNLMASQHADFVHEVVDGGFAEATIERLGIQAVPSVFSGDKLLHVGKGDLLPLLDALESHYGSNEAQESDASPPKEYDVVVVGGGPAGASAAIYSARKGLKTALIAERVGGQVQETLGIENFVGVLYTEGPRLSADFDKHVRSYPVDVLEHRRVERVTPGATHHVSLKGGESLSTRSLIVATGAKWRELGVVGEKEYLGRGVAFCPHCDGPFYKGRPIAVIGGGNSGVEAALDLAGICSHVTLIEFAETLRADAVLVEKMKERSNITVITHARTTEVVGDGAKVTSLRYQDRGTEKDHEVKLDGIFVQIGLVPNSAFMKDVVAVNRMGEIVVDDRCRTNVPGIYAAGDVTTVPFKQIVIALGEGAKAALTAFEDSLRRASA